jgi:hypothetical protein
VITDESGRPIPGALVRTHSTLVATIDQDVSSVRAGYSGDIGAPHFSIHGDASVTSQGRAARADDGGVADVAVAREGRVTIFVWAEGYRPAVVHAGWLDLSRSGARIVLRAAPAGGRTRVVRDGEPIGPCDVSLVVFDAGDAQDGVVLHSDDEGCLPTDWLEPGQAYWVHVKPRHTARGRPEANPHPGFMVWDDRPTLDVATALDHDVPPDVAASWRAARERQRVQHPSRAPPPLE